MEARDKAAATSGYFCEFISGDVHNDIDIELNLQMAQRCDGNKPFSITNYKNSSENFGIIYCCSIVKKDGNKVETRHFGPGKEEELDADEDLNPDSKKLDPNAMKDDLNKKKDDLKKLDPKAKDAGKTAPAKPGAGTTPADANKASAAGKPSTGSSSPSSSGSSSKPSSGGPSAGTPSTGSPSTGSPSAAGNPSSPSSAKPTAPQNAPKPKPSDVSDVLGE